MDDWDARDLEMQMTMALLEEKGYRPRRAYLEVRRWWTSADLFTVWMRAHARLRATQSITHIPINQVLASSVRSLQVAFQGCLFNKKRMPLEEFVRAFYVASDFVPLDPPHGPSHWKKKRRKKQG